jgi:hypothetical protein
MRVLQGRSSREDAVAAVAEATEGFGDFAPDLVLVFASTRQDPPTLASALAARFPGAAMAGCTTAGEILDGEHSTGSVVLSAIRSPEIRWTTGVIRDLHGLDEAQARAVADGLFSALGLPREDADPRRHFCLTFLDGLSCKEEHTVALMADALEGLPLLGGSSGDDLAFRRTHIFHGGEALTGAGVFVMAESKTPFEIVKHQHYTTTPRSLVITRADVPRRRVYEMDGYPALEAYARALGLLPAQVTDEVTFMNPLTFVCNGEIYVRSIQRVEPDGSIIFYCGIEEGMVLSLGGHEDMRSALERDLLREEPADLLIACNCILRALEATKRQHHPELGATLARSARRVVGFDTYGEQLNGLHINQTLVGIALRGAPEAS